MAISTTPSAKTFHPPSAEQLQRHLAKHPPRGPSRVAAWLPLLLVGVLLGLALASPNPLTMMLPWVLLLGLLVISGLRVRAVRTLESQVTQVQEQAMLRRYPLALRRAWRLLPRAAAAPAMHRRLIAFMAYCLGQVQAHETAIVAYDYLIEHLPRQHPSSIHLQIQRSMAQLQTHRLTDADDTLMRLRGITRQIQDATVRAIYRMAQLLQQVRTNHFEEAAEDSGNLLEVMRPLGIEAAYGYALMAVCFHHLTERRADAAAQSRLWWSRATLLMSPDRLINHFEDLACLRDLPGEPSIPPRGKVGAP